LNIEKDIKEQDQTFLNNGQVVVIFLRGGFDIARGGSLSRDTGDVILGDCLLDALKRAYHANSGDTVDCSVSPINYVFKRNNSQVAAHEFGHAVRLQHPSLNEIGHDQSIMEACPWPKCILLDSERRVIDNNPFFHVVFDANQKTQ
jgi:hypothetical protein